jgi:5-carboxymethyl-2-hydroxymuconate isomerase
VLRLNKDSTLPHITIEHDQKIESEIDLNQLSKSLHQCLASQDTVTLDSVKTRTIEVKNVIIGVGDCNRIIHIGVLLLSGRSKELKDRMAQELFSVAQTAIGELDCSLTVNVAELSAYKK